MSLLTKLSSSYGRITLPISCTRTSLFHTFTALKSEEPSTIATKLSKDQLKRRELRRLVQRKAAARKPAADHPLYMPVTQALRFLRAAEVGQPQSQQTISLTTLVISERGAPQLNGNISFPKPLKDVKIAVFTNDEDQLKIARDQFNCHLVGGSELIEKIKKGEVPLDFDKAFATPDIAISLTSQLGRILGPRGLLPNAKKGTVTEDISSLIKDSMGTLPFRQRGNCISIAVAKCSFTDTQVLENILAAQKSFKLALANQKAKKPSILGQTTLTTTHGPGLVIDFA